MTRMRKDRRDWLVDIHCVNHRVELAMKDGFDSSGFNEIDKLYTGIYNLCKHSGAIKTDIREAVETLNISIYSLTRLTGTRFIPHRRRALTRLLAMWPAIIAALENTIVVQNHKAETKAKISGFTKQLKNYQILCSTWAYLDVLEKMSPVALIFEKDHLLPSEVKPLIKRCILELEDLVDYVGEPNEMLDSRFSRFLYSEDDDGNKSLSASSVKFGHMLRDLENQETIEIQFE